MPITTHKSGGFSIEGEEAMKFYQMVSVLHALKLEERTKGKLRVYRGAAATTIARKVYGLHGKRPALIAAMELLVEEQRAKVTYVEER